MSAALELEIKALIDELVEPVAVAARLIPFVEDDEENFVPENVIGLCRFLLHAGLYAELISFVLKHLRSPQFKVPWPYFLDAIALSRPGIHDHLAAALVEGLDADNKRSEASRSKALDVYLPELKAQRADRRLQAAKAFRREKENLIGQLATLRTQQLYEQERQLLERLQKMYPNDEEVQREAVNHKERYALEILARHSRFSRRPRHEDVVDAEIEKILPPLSDSLRDNAHADPDLIPDLAVAATMWELTDLSLELLEYAIESEPVSWLRMELLLTGRRYLELLALLSQVERRYSEHPETFFATAYLRSQALWGLGQKESALEIMESLMSARPQYRSGQSLLAMWRQGL